MPDARIVTARTVDEVEALERPWSDAVARHGGTLYMTPEWVLSLWESHLGKRDAEFVVVRDGDEVRAIFPLTRSELRKAGLAFRQVGLVTNNYGQNHNELIVLGDATAADRLLRAIAEDGWDIFFVGSVPAGSATEATLRGLAADGRGRLVTEPYVASPYLDLEDTWDDFLRGRSANFRSDMKRKWNKAQSAGARFHVVREPDGVAEALRVILDIETRSWKESAGTSISVQATATRFYEIFLPRAARRGWLFLVLLELEGRPAAYDMGIVHGNKYYMLKTSFDQDLGALSPGVVLRQWVVQRLFEMGVSEHDFLGDADPYKLRWTDSVRQHSNLYLYNARSVRSRAYAWLRSLKR